MTRDEFYTFVDRKSLTRQIHKTGTPCYLFFSGIIARQTEALKRCLGHRFSIHYAVKANPHPGILKLMAGQGLGADVASMGELQAALSAGIPPEKIGFSGPGKTEEELRCAIEQGIGSVNAESREELAMLVRLGEELQKPVNAGIRVNPDLREVRSGIRMAGDTQFGIPEDRAGDALRFIKDHADQLRFTGLHVHIGSQTLDEEAIADHIQRTMDLGLALEQESGLRMKKINFGGGWGVAYFPGQEKPDPDIIAEELEDLFDTPRYRELRERADLILEPGRFLVAESGVYATKILYRKQVRAKDFAVVDGGMHQNYLIAGGMGQVVRRNFEMAILPRPGSETPKPQTLKLDVAGRLCTPQDILATDFEWDHEVRSGDYAVFFNCGAYGLSASPVSFLGHPHPAQVIVSGT